MSEEKQVRIRKPAQPKPVTIAVARGNQIEMQTMTDKGDVASFIAKKVKGGAAGIEDGKGTLITGEQFVIFRGTMVTPKIKISL